MQYKIPCTNGLQITDTLTIIDANGNVVIDKQQGTELDYQVDIEFNKWGTKSVSFIWLYLYARFQFPEFIDPSDILFYRLPNFREKLPWRPLFKSAYMVNKDYRVVPMCPHLAVSIDGDVINYTTGYRYAQHKGEYITVMGYKPQYQGYRPLRVHLLVANAWVLENQGTDNPVCNHIDGNKYHPHASNLEWVSLKGNASHAVKAGLYNVRHTRVRNRFTGEVTEFSSVKEAARFLNIKPDHMYEGGHGLNYLVNDTYELRLEGDDREWFYTEDRNIMNDDPLSRYIITVTDDTDKKYTFLGFGPFAEYYKLFDSAAGRSNPRSIQRFHELYPTYKVDVLDQYQKGDIQVLDIDTGAISLYKSVAEVAKYTHLRNDIVAYALKRNGVMVHNGYRMRYFSNDPWPNNPPKYTPRPIRVVDKTDQSVKDYVSMHQVDVQLGIPRKILLRMIKSPHASDRYIITKIRPETSA